VHLIAARLRTLLNPNVRIWAAAPKRETLRLLGNSHCVRMDILMRSIFLACTFAVLFQVSLAWASACTLLADGETGAVFFRDGPCEQRVSPASSFKIPLALMGFDAAILQDQHEPVWPYLPEYEALLASHKTNVDPTTWLWDSVVWYSQQLTSQLGKTNFARYVEIFNYGNKDVSGDPGLDNGLTHAWLSSSLSISAEEQIAFLYKMRKRQFSLSTKAYDLTFSIVPIYPMAEGWTAHGKSGSGWQRGRDGAIDMNRKLGWFIGWAVKGYRTVLFARLILDETTIDTYGGTRAREGLLQDLPRFVSDK
jgi:beta-lactamase class D